MPVVSGRRIAFLGGSFDPPHVAHVLLASYVLCLGQVDEVLVVPVCEHAFGKKLAPFEERLSMCRLAFAHLSQVRVTSIEQQLPRPNRTLATLQQLQREEPDASFRLVIGSDVLADAKKWHAFDEVAELAPPLVVARPGHPHAAPLVFPDVSSTHLRELLARADAAALLELGQLVPKATLDYALERGLYRSAQGSA